LSIRLAGLGGACFIAVLLWGCATYDGSSHPRRALGGAPETTGKASGTERRPTVYTVQRGDTLYSIAWRYDLKYQTVARWNDIGPPYQIYPGQELRLRAPADSDKEAPTMAASDSASTPKRNPAGGGGTGPSAGEASSTGAASHGPASGYQWQWPAGGPVVRDYANADYGKKGIAIGAGDDNAVWAAEGGRVVYSGNGLRGYGNLVIVKHGSEYLTAYGYNDELMVGEGDTVAAGDTIARVGETPAGKRAIHFELRRNGAPVNPLDYLPQR